MNLDKDSVAAFNKTPIPKFLSKEIGKLLRMGRTARRLSLIEAARMIAIKAEELDQYENGGEITPLEASYIAHVYGVLSDRVENILVGWAFAEARRIHQSKTRNHLAVVDALGKPWESPLSSVEDVVKITHQFFYQNKNRKN